MKVANIVGVMGRSTQGVTRPFLCRGEDGYTYFAKGRYVGCRGLIAEVLAGRLAQALVLPMAEFGVGHVPSTLIRESCRDDLQELGPGACFVSRELIGCEELRHAGLAHVPQELRARVLLFDWWVGNGDRTLSEHGGNPNLLLCSENRSLHIIDHNLAFDTPLAGFWDQHVFRSAREAWSRGFRAVAETEMSRLLGLVPGWWAGLPEEWTGVSDQRLPENLRLLARFRGDSGAFWEP